MKNFTEQAWSFTRKIKSFSSQHLIQYMESIGWNVVYFDSEEDDFLKSVHLSAFSCGKGAFAYSSQETRVVFIRSGRSERDASILLLHEIGHILLGHKLDSIDAGDEEEANCFVDQCARASRFSWIKVTAIAIIAVAMLVAAAAAGALCREKAIVAQYNLPQASIEVVVTSSGTKYHIEGCRYVVGKANIKRMLADEAEREGYSPCKVCWPK